MCNSLIYSQSFQQVYVIGTSERKKKLISNDFAWELENTPAEDISGKDLLGHRNYAVQCYVWYVKRVKDSFMENEYVAVRDLRTTSASQYM